MLDVKYLPSIIENGYKVHMKLTIKSLGIQDYGIYKCVSKNSLGESEGTIKVYSMLIISKSTNYSVTVNNRNDFRTAR